MNKDTVYSFPQDSVDAFAFDARVADVFENMISRSVPGYGLNLEFIGLLTENFATPGSNCYDLGCSLGASTLMIRRHAPAGCHVIGIDNSGAMVERCRANVARDHSEASIEIREEDLRDSRIDNASLVAMNFTLQFIAPGERARVLSKIAEGMNWGGALVLSEKVRFDTAAQQDLMSELHHEFKRFHGYSDLEIAQKRAALENILVPDTEHEHITRLHEAGFGATCVLTRCLNFASFLAIRRD